MTEANFRVVVARSSFFSGNAQYCYSNSLRMCLVDAGLTEPEDLDPGYLEALTGMPFGALSLSAGGTQLFLPSPSILTPVQGLQNAMAALGVKAKSWSAATKSRAWSNLIRATRKGTPLVGPVDIGELPHNPAHARLAGGDHFVSVLQVDGSTVHFHDPFGYPFATLPRGPFLKAWEAKAIDYPHDPFGLISNFAVKERRTRDQIVSTGLSTARELMRNDRREGPFLGGPDAFRQTAANLRYRPARSLREILLHFSLALGARRSADAATFLELAGRTQAAEIAMEKATLYGQAQFPASQARWDEVAGHFDSLAQQEAALRLAI